MKNFARKEVCCLLKNRPTQRVPLKTWSRHRKLQCRKFKTTGPVFYQMQGKRFAFSNLRISNNQSIPGHHFSNGKLVEYSLCSSDRDQANEVRVNTLLLHGFQMLKCFFRSSTLSIFCD